MIGEVGLELSIKLYSQLWDIVAQHIHEKFTPVVITLDADILLVVGEVIDTWGASLAVMVKVFVPVAVLFSELSA